MRRDTRVGNLLLLGLALLPALVALAAPLDTSAAWLRAGGRLTGVVGLAWLLLAAALAVRIPGLDRPFGGLVRVWRIHHGLGTGAFLLLMAHVLLLAFAAVPAGLAVASVTLFPLPPDADRGITLQELAQHDSAESCWKAIDGVGYDFTDYLPDHPTPPRIMLRWCGKESTEAYQTKGYGNPHSAAADAMLPQYRIGVLVD